MVQFNDTHFKHRFNPFPSQEMEEKPTILIPCVGSSDEDKERFLHANTDAVFTTIPVDKVNDLSTSKVRMALAA